MNASNGTNPLLVAVAAVSADPCVAANPGLAAANVAATADKATAPHKAAFRLRTSMEIGRMVLLRWFPVGCSSPRWWTESVRGITDGQALWRLADKAPIGQPWR